MADYNKNYMAAYKQYGESMIAGGGGTNLSGTGSSTMQVWNYGNDDQPSGLGAPTAKPKEEKKSESFWDRITNLFTSNDVDVTTVYTPSVNPASVYDSDAFNPAQVEDYVYRADMSEQTQDMVEQAMGYEKTKLGQLQLLDTRAMTEEEKKRLGPLLDLADDISNQNITTTELPPIEGEQQSSLMDALMEGQPTAGLMQRPSVFTGQETRIASTLPDWMEALPLEGFSQALIDIREGRIDRETGQPIVQEEEVDLSPPEAADQELIPTTRGGADVAPEIDTTPPEQTGLMSRRMDGKDGDLAESVAPFSVEEDELYNFVKEAYPDNDLAAGALLATIEAESAGGDTMLESGNYTKEAALRVANQGEFKTARKKEVEKIFKDPDLTYTDSKGRTRMTKEGQVKFFNIYYNDKYRGEDYKLGNTEEGDGFRFRGRGPIQLTGKNNYKKYGDMIGVDLVQNPQLVVTDKDVALAVTKAYMNDKGLDKVSSAKGLRNIVGHADDAKLSKAKARWKRAQEIERMIKRETSPRPMLRPTE